MNYLSRQDVLKIQYLKLLNYHTKDLDRSWKMGVMDSDGYQNSRFLDFASFTGYYDWSATDLWIHRRVARRPWGPANCYLSDQPDPIFWKPTELYLQAGGAVLTLKRAARYLAVDKEELIRLKYKHIFDVKVIAECLSRMLRPRPTWPELISVRPDLKPLIDEMEQDP